MSLPPMPGETFWAIIDPTTEAHDQAAQMKALHLQLRGLSLEELVSFQMTFRRYLNHAYSWDLWGAAYVINGGCSDDGFEYFRRWLVSRGRKIYEAALENPESLASVEIKPSRGIWEFEPIYYITRGVFEEMGGKGDPDDHCEREACLGEGITGEPFEEDDDHLARRYPRLWRRFGTHQLILRADD